MLQAKGDPSSQAQLSEKKVSTNAIDAATRGLHTMSDTVYITDIIVYVVSMVGE